MDPWTILTWVALFIGMIAGVVQVVDYVQKMREKRQEVAMPGRAVAMPAAPPPLAQPAAPQPESPSDPPRPRHNLPMQPTTLVGRAEEVAQLAGWLRKADVRLVTLTGPGGVGKSRVALRAAEELLPDYRDGVWLVPLANVHESALLAQAIAGALGVKPEGARALIDALKGFLREKNALLVLDNFEQLVEAAPLLADILSEAPSLKMLVTSRSALRLMGEREMPIAPLEVPSTEYRAPSGSDKADAWYSVLGTLPSVQLFVERAQAVRPDFTLTPENAGAVAEICARLDGLPLAIELAAARAKLLTPQAIAERLRGSFKLLSGGARDLPARQQTLYGAIAWSYDLLQPVEQALFRRLSVFRGGCTLEAAEEIMAARGVGTEPLEMDVVDGLGSLIDKSLMRQEDAETVDRIGGGEARFSMLATIRDFGRDKLRESKEEGDVCRAHAMFYLRLVEDVEPRLMSVEQVTWLDRLEREHENIRTALDWSLGEGGDKRVGLRLAGALLWFWQTRGYLGEGRARLESLLNATQEAQYGTERSKALVAAGRLATLQADYGAARQFFEENLEIQRVGGDEMAIGHAQVALGSAATGEGDYGAARALYEEALTHLGEESSSPYSAMALVGLGEACLDAGDPESARPSLERSLALFRKLGNKAGAAFALYNLGYAAQETGDSQEARARFLESLQLREELGNRQSIAMCLFGLADVASSEEEWERAAILLAAGQRLLRETGTRLGVADGLRYKRAEETARAGLSEEEWDAAWALGSGMGVKEAVKYGKEVASLG